MAPRHASLYPPLLQFTSQCNSQVRLSFNTSDALRDEILLNPRATGTTSKLLLPSKTLPCPIPPIREEPSSHTHRHTAHGLTARCQVHRLGWQMLSSQQESEFSAWVWGQVFLAGQSFQKALYSIFAPVLLVLPVVGSAPRTQQCAGGKGTRGEKSKLLEQKRPERYSRIGGPPACTRAAQLARTHLPQFPHLLKQPNPHPDLLSSDSEQRMVLTKRCTPTPAASSPPWFPPQQSTPHVNGNVGPIIWFK